MLRMQQLGLAITMAVGCGPEAPAVHGGASGSTTRASSAGTTVAETGDANTSNVGPSATSGPASTSSDGGGFSTTCGFLCTDPDDPFECSVFAQDCPPGERCSPSNQFGSHKCVPVAEDPAQVGEPCTIEGAPYSGVDSCDVGSLCWFVDDETGLGTCFAHCGGSEIFAVCPDPNEGCWMGSSGLPAICIPQCDPLDPTSCNSGEGCLPVPWGFQCLPASDAGPLEPCRSKYGCAPGLVCLASDTVGCTSEFGCCTHYCDLLAPDCPDSTTCVPYSESPVPAGFEHIGYCVVPSH